MDCPKVVVTTSHIPGAWAYAYGPFGKSICNEVSREALNLFRHEKDSPQLEAIVAHELAHLKAKHSYTDTLLRYVGRFTFVGDGFVRAIENTYGYEIEADEIAIRDFGVDPTVLRHALWRIRNVMAASGEFVTEIAEGTPLLFRNYAQYLAEPANSLSFVKQWRLAIKAFLDYYLGRDRTAYWHPSLDDRVEHLSS